MKCPPPRKPGTGEQKLDAVLYGSDLGKQPQRRTEPARSTLGREPCRCLAGITQDGHSFDVALARRPLDVVGARRRCRSPHRERFRTPLVRPELPAARGGLVDSAPDERVAEAEPSGHVGRPNQIDAQELVDCVHRRSLGCGGGSSRQFGLERIAGHRRSFEHEASASDSNASSSLSDAATAAGTSRPVSEISGAAVRPSARPSDRASCSR